MICVPALKPKNPGDVWLSADPVSSTPKPVIFSLSGPVVTDEERSLFQSTNPLGFILFTRNCENPAQTKALTDDLRSIVGRNCPILIDQEGGRVVRLKPPHWREHPPVKTFGNKAEKDLKGALEDLRFRTLRIAEELVESGITANCDPCADLYIDGAHDVIGDRAFSADPTIVGRLALSVCRHYLAAGITPIMKHIPGHGRAMVDSHDEVPVISTSLDELRRTDFVPFKTIAESDVHDQVWAMPSPVLYPAIDPENAACTSPTLINDIIRGEIGFNGIVISDALDMGGFDEYGPAASRVLAVLNAGCDLALHCTGKFEEMAQIAEAISPMREDTAQRLRKTVWL